MSDPKPCPTCGRWWNNLCSDAFHMEKWDRRNLRDASADLAKAQAEVALMSCGHPRVMQDRSVESGVEFCGVCRNLEMLRDALHMEQHYKAERDALKAQLADAEKVMEAARIVGLRVTEQDLRRALAAYDSKWRAGK